MRPAASLRVLVLLAAAGVLAAAAAPFVQNDWVAAGAFLKQQPDTGFAADLGSVEPQDSSGAGETRTVDATTAPVLQTLGMSVQLVDLPACAQRGPYIAPGFMLYVLKGRNVTASLLDSSNRRLVSNDLAEGWVGFSPPGMVGYFYNNACKAAQLLLVYNTPDLSMGLDLFALDTMTALMPAANLAAGMGAPDYLTTEWVDSTKYHTASECEGRCFGPDGPSGS